MKKIAAVCDDSTNRLQMQAAVNIVLPIISWLILYLCKVEESKLLIQMIELRSKHQTKILDNF